MAGGIAVGGSAVRPNIAAAQSGRMPIQNRNIMMERMNPAQRAQSISAMSSENRAQAMLRMNPEQRAQTLAHLSPQVRQSLLAPQFRNANLAQRAMGFGAGALAGAAASRMMMRGNESTVRGATVGGRMIPSPPAFANPRQPQFGPGSLSTRLSPRLNYRAETANVPRIGNARTGIAGPFDPGGYVRSSALQSRLITPSFARAQFAQNFQNFNNMAALNHANMVGNRGAWPWQLPVYSPSWFGNQSYPWAWNHNWYQNGWNNWWGNPGWWNGYGGSLPWWATVLNLWPFGFNSGLGWSPYLNYYNGYNYDGANYQCNYFADNGYCPTDYVFSVPNGQFWQVGRGYSDYLPPNYHAPITVAVKESVPQYGWNGEIVAYSWQTFYYNAFWDPQQQSYGYYDYRQQFHWLTFPWLRSWTGYS
jgi:hypothetical protein